MSREIEEVARRVAAAVGVKLGDIVFVSRRDEVVEANERYGRPFAPRIVEGLGSAVERGEKIIAAFPCGGEYCVITSVRGKRIYGYDIVASVEYTDKVGGVKAGDCGVVVLCVLPLALNSVLQWLLGLKIVEEYGEPGDAEAYRAEKRRELEGLLLVPVTSPIAVRALPAFRGGAVPPLIREFMDRPSPETAARAVSALLPGATAYPARGGVVVRFSPVYLVRRFFGAYDELERAAS